MVPCSVFLTPYHLVTMQHIYIYIYNIYSMVLCIYRNLKLSFYGGITEVFMFEEVYIIQLRILQAVMAALHAMVFCSTSQCHASRWKFLHFLDPQNTFLTTFIYLNHHKIILNHMPLYCSLDISWLLLFISHLVFRHGPQDLQGCEPQATLGTSVDDRTTGDSVSSHGLRLHLIEQPKHLSWLLKASAWRSCPSFIFFPWGLQGVM